MKKISEKIIKLAQSVYDELGGGFTETVHPEVGLSIELNKAKIHYLREQT